MSDSTGNIDTTIPFGFGVLLLAGAVAQDGSKFLICRARCDQDFGDDLAPIADAWDRSVAAEAPTTALRFKSDEDIDLMIAALQELKGVPAA